MRGCAGLDGRHCLIAAERDRTGDYGLTCLIAAVRGCARLDGCYCLFAAPWGRAGDCGLTCLIAASGPLLRPRARPGWRYVFGRFAAAVRGCAGLDGRHCLFAAARGRAGDCGLTCLITAEIGRAHV